MTGKRSFVLILFLTLFFTIGGGQSTHASDESDTVKQLMNRVSIYTLDGFLASGTNLSVKEGAIYISLANESDLKLFMDLSDSTKKHFINSLAQNYYGEYLGATTCYSVVFYGNTAYAGGTTSYKAKDAEFDLHVYVQGKTDMLLMNDFPYAVLQPAQEPIAPVEPAESIEPVESVEPAPSVEPKQPDLPKKELVTLKEKGIVLKGTSMAPAAAAVKTLGGSLQLTPTQEVVVTYAGKTFKGKVNASTALINGATVSYPVPLQIIDGKLLVPIKALQQLFDASLIVNKDDRDCMESITLATKTKQVTIPINDLYEKYHNLVGKTAWLNNNHLYLTNLQGAVVSLDIPNYTKITITDYRRGPETALIIRFIYKGKTYDVDMPEEHNYLLALENPQKKYKIPQKYWDDIQKNKISTGMHAFMVLLSWGAHDQKTAVGSYEEWVYEFKNRTVYLYFDNLILTNLNEYTD
jgi:hypothetical protein